MTTTLVGPTGVAAEPEAGAATGRWYQDAIIYQVHVRTFCDSDGDGIGDFRGLTSKLEYLQSLGVTALWLMPFYPSPLRDDGYDIADYTNVHPSYGTLHDFKVFLRAAHRHGLRVITELVLNHTSDQHPWFQRARRAAPGSAERNFYVWSDTPDRYRDARIIFKDFETSNWAWDPVARAYYWHRFYSHQPDLNYDNPAVFRAITRVLDFWLKLGVDGLRLDAVPYLYEREGTSCENLPETHAALKRLRAYIDQRYTDRMLLAEANQWPEDAVAYFGDGDECHMAFHFPVMPRLFMAIRQEDRFPIIDILAQTPAIPDNAQWGLFLRNHDELTLEMVTDEERDYMYRVYAADPEARINLGIRRRLAPLLGNHRRRIELMNALLFALPGTPFLYYGDELGMGDNIFLGDRNGVRTPMQWSPDRNAGFSTANPQRLYLPVIIDPEYHYETVNVEAQQRNPHSLLWWMRRLIALRKRHPAFGRGTLEFLTPQNRAVLALVRRYGDEVILALFNLSRFVQYVELDLSAFAGLAPVEMFGRTVFPPITDQPYFFSLGPHAFFWFTLEPPAGPAPEVAGPGEAPVLVVSDGWERLLREPERARLERILPAYLRARRWFRGKARSIKAARLVDVIPLSAAVGRVVIALVAVDYQEGDPETYLLPLAWGDTERAVELRARAPQAVIAEVRDQAAARTGVLYDALWEPSVATALLEAVAHRRRFRGLAGELTATPTSAFAAARGPAGQPLPVTVAGAEQSNTSLVIGDRLILKLYRRLEAGVNPELELGRLLTERAAFPHTPAVAGALEYRRGPGEPMTVGLLQAYVPNEGDAWQYTLAVLDRYFDEALARQPELPELPLGVSLVALSERQPPPLAEATIGGYLEAARLLGQRTGELHLALALATDVPAVAPEPFTPLYQRSLYQSARTLTTQVVQALRQQVPALPADVQPLAQAVLAREGELAGRLRAVLTSKLSGQRMRCHGDYHLGQVLSTGRDFVIIDFEGEPARPLGERRLKRSPLRDVAGMLRSFDYAVATASAAQAASGAPAEVLAPWGRFWERWVSATFLNAYLRASRASGLLPATDAEIDLLLEFLLLEKAIYELGYELNNRPTWVAIPLRGILALLDTAGPPERGERGGT
jgi:maltose alpha-D-glucosyltransferase/alpha-amylase